MAGTPVLFLDRDGTVNVDMGKSYLNHPDKTLLIPGAGRAILKAKNAGFKIGIITNQAGVAKGFTPKENLPLIHQKLEGLIAREAGVSDFRFDDIRMCMHHPDEKCRCRKPEVQMLEEAIAALNADVKRSFFIGDKETDLLCGDRLGVRSILVRTGNGAEAERLLPTLPKMNHFLGVADSLTEAVELALRSTNTAS